MLLVSPPKNKRDNLSDRQTWQVCDMGSSVCVAGDWSAGVCFLWKKEQFPGQCSLCNNSSCGGDISWTWSFSGIIVCEKDNSLVTKAVLSFWFGWNKTRSHPLCKYHIYMSIFHHKFIIRNNSRRSYAYIPYIYNIYPHFRYAHNSKGAMLGMYVHMYLQVSYSRAFPSKSPVSYHLETFMRRNKPCAHAAEAWLDCLQRVRSLR